MDLSGLLYVLTFEVTAFNTRQKFCTNEIFA